MGRIKRDTDAGVDGQDELLVALSPVLDDSNIAGRSTGSRHHPLIPFFPHRRIQLPPTHTQTGIKETSNDDHNPLRKLEEAEDKTCNDHNPVSKLTCSVCVCVCVSVQRRERSWRLLKPLLRTSACVHDDDEGTAVRLFIHQYPCTS